MTFNGKQHAAIQRWMGHPIPLRGVYFRSVECRFMDPADVLSGAGARAHGGRFAAVGIRAVYLSTTDSGASKEVTARKARLGGAAQISTDKYPRVVYAVAVNLKRVLDLTSLEASNAGEAVKVACLNKADLTASMELSGELVAEGIQGLLFQSAMGGDDNLVVYRANCGRRALTLTNVPEVIHQAKRIAARYK